MVGALYLYFLPHKIDFDRLQFLDMPQHKIQTKPTRTEETRTNCLPKDRRTSLKEKVCMVFPYAIFAAYIMAINS